MKRRLSSPWGMLTMAAVAAAVVQELSKPADERTWQGRVFGIVPYDFRLPTLDRVKASYWNPDDARLLTPTVFGIGWGLNLYQLTHQLRAAVGQS